MWGEQMLPYPGSQPPCSTMDVAHGTRHPCHHSEVTLSLSHPVPVLPSQTLPSKPLESPSCGYTATQSPRPGCTWLDLPHALDTPDTLDAAMPFTVTQADTP